MCKILFDFILGSFVEIFRLDLGEPCWQIWGNPATGVGGALGGEAQHQHSHQTSKNPSRQSLVREKLYRQS